MGNVAIRTEGLGKQYRLGENVCYKTLRESWRDGFRRGNDKAGSETIWALRDISFEVKRGEVVGVIGRNGAGKSTLLKILSRITRPTTGLADIHGRVGSLLEVGTGFHPELTGRENIFLNGAILGMTRREVLVKFDEIVAFAEIERFLDTPVKRYSSGMYVRLAFAVAAHLEPDILLVDEVLAVGDIAFQRKCLGKMEDIAGGGRTVLFVSHNMTAVRSLCQRGIVLESGAVKVNAPMDQAIKAYIEAMQRSGLDGKTAVGNEVYRRGSGATRFTDLQILGEEGSRATTFEIGTLIRFRLSFEIFRPVSNLHVSIALRTGKQWDFVTSMRYEISDKPLPAGHKQTIKIELPKINLRPGEYPLYFWMGDNKSKPFDVVDGLTAPLIIVTRKTFEELGYDPAKPSGYFDIPSRLVI